MVRFRNIWKWSYLEIFEIELKIFINELGIFLNELRIFENYLIIFLNDLVIFINELETFEIHLARGADYKYVYMKFKYY